MRLQDESSSWFDASPAYAGRGIVQLSDPAAVLEGDAIASVDDRGLVHLSVRIETMNGAPVAFLVLHDLITRECRVPAEGGFRITRHVANPCATISVRTETGSLRLVESPRRYSMHCRGAEPEVSLEFVLETADYAAREDQPATFWVLPLSNLVTRFAPREDSLDAHPLLFGDAKRGGGLISFRRCEALGFIAPLSDYRTRERDLDEGRMRRTVTAVAVGTFDDALRRAGELAWIRLRHSFELLDLCSLSPVGVPWTEIRAADGGLLRRLHHGAQVPAYLPGSPPIDEFWVRDSGSLVSAALANEVVNRPFFRSAVAKIVRSGEQDSVIEHCLLDVFIGLDTLCDAYETKRQPRLSSLLPTPAYKQVRSIIDQAEGQLRAFESSETSEGIVEILRGVRNRVRAAPYRTELGFTQALLRLMDHFGLADGLVIARHFPTDNPTGQRSRSPNETWTSLISRYRSIVVHNGCFERLPEERLDHPRKVLTHLRDVLIRLVLIAVGYDGCYFPEMFDREPPRDSHWVTPDTPLEDLGYFVGVTPPWPRRLPQ